MDNESYKKRMGLVETSDPEVDKPIHRRPGFQGIQEFSEMDAAIGKFIRERRNAVPLTRNELQEFLGLTAQVYGRYERGFSKMTATRVVHLAELLGFHPIELFCVIAPHFFGENDEDAQKKLQ
ncbi:helix-turn-helix domain-containing protein, partial [Notoacmeibacter sp. MSK16QG-6]|uniref:helix-turn-helix domain-containing protein n=1 Tax=Notoacmeibacter sp. MSK16QG-6 TaxID=2957982 RepID=UPI0020A151E2